MKNVKSGPGRAVYRDDYGKEVAVSGESMNGRFIAGQCTLPPADASIMLSSPAREQVHVKLEYRAGVPSFRKSYSHAK